MKRLSALAVAALCLAAQGMIFAQDDKADAGKGKFDGKVATVSVFKNGYGFFRVEGTADVAGGRTEVATPPAAALGTWWFYTRAEGAVIDSVVAGQRETTKPRAALSLDELIAANAGKTATVTTEKATYTGAIVDTFSTRTAFPTPEERARSAYGGGAPMGLLLRTDDGNVTYVRPGDVQSVTIAGGASDFTPKEKEGYVTLSLAGAKDGPVPVGYQFLQKGIRWIPSYRVEVVDDKTAALTLQGEVVNDIHDLDKATLQLVVGVPNFMTGELLSPISYITEAPRLSVFFQPPGQGRRDDFSNAMMSQAAGPYSYGGVRVVDSQSPAPGTPVPSDFTTGQGVGSQAAADLFYYTKDNVTLKSGERASLNLLAATVPYVHIHKWTATGQVQGRDRNDDRNSPPPGPAVETVDHYLRLTNSTAVPFTSGPALLFEKGAILAQDLMYYTPAGGDADVKITTATDVKAGQSGEEISRNRGALQVYSGPAYDLVKANVVLTVKNFKKEPVKMLVAKELDGVVEEAPEAKTIAKDTSRLASVNPHSRVEYEFDLAPGQEKEMIIIYSTYVRP